MLYTLLLRGRGLPEGHFLGSYTLQRWEELAQKLRFIGGNPSFPKPTPRNTDHQHILHFAFQYRGRPRQILFSEYAGENFDLWSKDETSALAEIPRWLHAHSSGFLLFADCQALAAGKARARKQVEGLAQRLAGGLNNRPVALAWSKADCMRDVHPRTVDKLRETISKWIPNVREFEISSVSRSDHDPRVHTNNWAAVEFLLRTAGETQPLSLARQYPSHTPDFFLNYGKHE